MQQYADATGQPAGNVHLRRAQERYVVPSQLPSGAGGVLRSEVWGAGKDGAFHVFGGETVKLLQGVQELHRGPEYRLRGIGLSRRRAAQPAQEVRHLSSRSVALNGAHRLRLLKRRDS